MLSLFMRVKPHGEKNVNKLPPILTTCKQITTLYKKSYIDLWPFTALFVLCTLVEANLVPAKKEMIAGYFAYKFGFIVLHCLFYSIALCVINEINSQHAFRYGEVVKKGLKRLIPLLGSWLIVFLIAVLIGVLLGFATELATGKTAGSAMAAGHSAANVGQGVQVIKMVIMAIAGIVFLVAFNYIIISPVLLVNKGRGPWESLHQSWRLVSGYWFNTFFMALILVLVTALIAFPLIYFIDTPHASAFIHLITFPLWPSFLVVQHQHLERAHRAA